MRSLAYVLIEAEPGQIGAVLEALRRTPGISAADPVTGPYDIIAVISTDDQRGIGPIIIESLHKIDGIKRTISCLVLS